MHSNCVVIFCLISLASCSGCPRGHDEIVSVSGKPATLQKEAPQAPVEVVNPPHGGGEGGRAPSSDGAPGRMTGRAPVIDPLATLAKSGPPPVPPGAYVADDLTKRLKEKMAEAYDGELSKVPDAKIYLGGDMVGFTKFYEQRGYKTMRVTIPVSQIIQSALRERPELEDRIRLSDYDGVVIEQVMVEGTGVSAADKYIDPDTLKVVDKLFITVMPLK